MELNDTFPLRFWFNQGVDEERRFGTQAKLEESGIRAERFPRIHLPQKEMLLHSPMGSGISKEPEMAIPVRGYANATIYAKALTLRLGIREAKRRKAPAVLLLEDDWVIHPNFAALFASLDLPEDWAVLHLGCYHLESPSWQGPRVVRVRRANLSSAVAIRASHFREVMKLLNRYGKDPELREPSAAHSVEAHDSLEWCENASVPIYACSPNLIWQDGAILETHGAEGPNFTRDGKQVYYASALDHLLPELITGAPIYEAPPTVDPAPQIKLSIGKRTKLGLLFLTRGDVCHPSIWKEFVAEAPDQVAIYSHAKHPRRLAGGFLDGKIIGERHKTEWGGISLVRASRSLLLEAMQDEEITHFALLSETCVPLVPLPEILRRFSRDPRSQFIFRRVSEASAVQATRTAMVPEIPAGCWRFQSQWWIMNRVTATFAVGQDYTELFEKMMVPDEAYFATVLAMQGFPLEGEVVKKVSTWTSWKKGTGSPRAWAQVPLERVQSAIESGAIFGRKFLEESDIGSYQLHRSIQMAAAQG
jgi:Core-2/I-Branching enzyme